MLACAGLFSLSACFRTEVAGTGTETSTKSAVVGRILDLEGAAASSTEVTLIPEDFDAYQDAASALLRDTTDADGSYRFSVREPGRYNLQAVHIGRGRRTRWLATGIECGGEARQIATGTLAEPGSLALSLSEARLSASGHIYVPGTTLAVFLGENTGGARLDSVPIGKLPAIAFAAKDSQGISRKRILRYNVTVAPAIQNETAEIVA